jgi:hypothetical protein
MAASHRHDARPHIPEEVLSGDFDRIAPAKAEHFERCNACRYTFRKRGNQIDHADFRSHKESCPKRS